jgi:hypothetical protein
VRSDERRHSPASIFAGRRITVFDKHARHQRVITGRQKFISQITFVVLGFLLTHEPDALVMGGSLSSRAFSNSTENPMKQSTQDGA